MKAMEWIKGVMEDNNLKGARGVIALIFCVISSCFFIYTGFRGSFDSYVQRGFMLLIVSSIIFLTSPFMKKDTKLTLAIDLIFVVLSCIAFGYVILQSTDLMLRAGRANTTDIILAVLSALLVVEATRRKIGLTLPILVIIFILYGILGPYIPIRAFMHKGMSLSNFATVIYMSEDGLFGIPAQSAANFIMIFVIFGAFLNISGAGEFFIKLSTTLFGTRRGGTAKVAIVASALMGMISGSAVANVAATGSFTIPLMKDNGYKDYEAAAINAVSSTGGQIMPPVMGSAAFIMADTLGLPYWNVVKAALIPAVLYYIAQYYMVHLAAVRGNLQPMKRENLPPIKEVLKDSYLFLPIVSLVYFLGIARFSAQKSAFYTLIVVLVLSMFKKKTRITPRKFLSGLVQGAMGGLEVGIVCGCAGLVIGVVLRSGLGTALTGGLITLANGRLIILMILTMIASIIMGMGLPTSACYVIAATLIAPAMVQMGVIPMAAHLFCFYFGCLSAITPPVALASYAAAGVAGSPPMKTGWEAVRYGLCGFIVPYMFVYGPALMLEGGIVEIILAVSTSLFGCYILAVSLMGHQFMKVQTVFRPVYFIAAMALIIPGWQTDVVGLALAGGLTVFNYIMNKRNTTQIPA